MPRFTRPSAERSGPRERAAPRPIDAARLEALALSYASRFATSAAKLDGYLRRKIRAAGWDGEADPVERIAALVARFVSSGYVDDVGFAQARAGSLLRRGFGERRISQALHAAGIDEGIRASVMPGTGDARQAALALARKRRFGPFAPTQPDPAQRERQIAAMLRAGHRLDSARALVLARSEAAALDWAEQG